MADSGAPPGENLTLAQIAAQQTAAMQAMQGRGRGRGRGRGGDPKPKKLTKAQIAAQERAAAAHAAQAAAVASAAPQIPMHQMPGVPTQMPPPGVPVQQHQQQQQAPGPGGGPPRPPPLRQRSPVDVQNELRQNLELIKREMVESKNAFDRTGRTYEPPKYVVKAQFDAAIGVELWLDDHSKNFDANELAKKIAMLQGIQTKCAKGILDENPFEALCCWVELTKTYYICVRESRNLTMRGVGGIVPPTFVLPVDSRPAARHPGRRRHPDARAGRGDVPDRGAEGVGGGRAGGPAAARGNRGRGADVRGEPSEGQGEGAAGPAAAAREKGTAAAAAREKEEKEEKGEEEATATAVEEATAGAMEEARNRVPRGKRAGTRRPWSRSLEL